MSSSVAIFSQAVAAGVGFSECAENSVIAIAVDNISGAAARQNIFLDRARVDS